MLEWSCGHYGMKNLGITKEQINNWSKYYADA